MSVSWKDHFHYSRLYLSPPHPGIISFINFFNYKCLHINTDYVVISQRRQAILQSFFLLLLIKNFESPKGFIFTGFCLPFEYNTGLCSDTISKECLFK